MIGAGVLRRANARLRVQVRRAGHHVDAGFEKGVRERVVGAVADEGRSREAGVRVIAAAGDPEGHAIPSGAQVHERAPRAKLTFREHLHRTYAPIVRVRGMERVRLDIAPTAAPGGLEVHAPGAAGHGAEHAEFRHGGRGAVGRAPRRNLRFGDDRLRGRGCCPAERGHHEETGGRVPHGQRISRSAPGCTSADPFNMEPPGRQA
jgi:hypothetical protein